LNSNEFGISLNFFFLNNCNSLFFYSIKFGNFVRKKAKLIQIIIAIITYPENLIYK